MRRRGLEPAREDEEACRVVGGLIRQLPAEPEQAAWQPAWDPLRRALRERSGWSWAPWRRRSLIAALAGVSLVFVLVAVGRRSLHYKVEGGGTVSANGVETTAGQTAVLRFSDGSTVTLSGDSGGRVTALERHGATIALEHGRASFDVIHRSNAHWGVTAGPFEILVTGTRFDVELSGETERFLRVDLEEGTIVVRGAPTESGFILRAGQRLVADLARHKVTVVGIKDRGNDATGAGQSRMATSPTLVPTPVTAPTKHDVHSRERLRGRSDEVLDGPGGPRASLTEEERPEARPAPPVLQPEPSLPPASPSGLNLEAGGSACLGWTPQFTFDRSIGSAYAMSITALGLSHAAFDPTRSWCGAGSLRADAHFDLSGTLNHIQMRPHQSGNIQVQLPAPVDLTGKTISAHIYVEAPSDVRFAAEILALDQGKWVGGGYLPDLASGRWLTIASHTYARDNPLFGGGTSRVDSVETVIIQIYSVDNHRIWNGKVFLDDIGWR
jgi:ferric-dicitrate binding protein FerR (iron transport regulator)